MVVFRAYVVCFFCKFDLEYSSLVKGINVMTIALKITICVNVGSRTAQKMKFFVENFFSKCG